MRTYSPELILREAVLAELTDACTIERPARTADGLGGWSEAWSLVAEDVPCRLEQGTGEETVDADRIGARAACTLHVPAGTDLRLADRVTIDSGIFDVVAGSVLATGAPAFSVIVARRVP